MTGNRKPSRHEKKPSGTDSGTKGSGTGAPSSSVLDFIYLDESKIFSYLSQLRGGLTLLSNEVQDNVTFRSREAGGDKQGGTTNAEAQISPLVTGVLAALGLATGNPLAGAIAGAGGKFTYEGSWEETTPTLTNAQTNKAGRHDLSILHHAAFNVVQEQLADKLITVKGKLTVLSMDFLMRVSNFAISGPDKPEMLATIQLVSDLGMDAIAYVESKEKRFAHAFLARRHSLLPYAEFTASYGTRSEVDFTVVGLHAQNTASARRTTPHQLDGAQETRLLLDGIETAMTQAQRLFGAEGTERLQPLAIYREL